ncbi:MAG: hypothetical protein FWH48_05765 [Oscillospiraceae bacterium]|nr:hypothetical protein [Oscillospiraceae bacterium]
MFNKKKRMIFHAFALFLLLPLLPFIFTGCEGYGAKPADTKPTETPPPPSVNEDYKPQDAVSGTLEIDLNNVINPDLIGAGVNFNFCYIAEMDLQTGQGTGGFPNTAGMSKTDAQNAWDEFFALIDYMDFTYVRFMVSTTMWEPVNDNADPWETDFDGGFVFSPNFRQKHPEVSENNYLYMEAMYKILDHFEATGKYVVIANWGRGSTSFCPGGDNWMSERQPDGSSYDLFSPPSDQLLIADINELTESLAALLYHLIAEKGYACVKGVSLWNEPEGQQNYQKTLVGMYNSMGDQLTRLGIRDKCLIQAYDGVTFYSVDVGWDKNRIAKMAPLCGENMDIISLHDYFGRMNYLVGGDNGATHGTFYGFSIPELWQPALVQASVDGKSRPVIMGELGSFQFNGGNEMTPADFRSQLSNAEMIAISLNMGYKGFGAWVFNLPWQTHFSMLGTSPSDPKSFVPDSTNYYPASLYCKYIKAGSSIVSSEVGGFLDLNGIQRVYAAAAKSGNDVTVLLVNDDEKPAAVTVMGLNGSQTYFYWYVCDGKTDGIYSDGGFIPSSEGGDVIYLRPQSITILTTFTNN